MRWDLVPLEAESLGRVKAVVRHLVQRGWPAEEIRPFGRLVVGVDAVLEVSDAPPVQLWVLG